MVRLRFSSDLYIDDAISAKFGKIKRQIRYGKGKQKGYVVVKNEFTDKLEGISLKFLKQKYYQESRQEIVAVLKDYQTMLQYLAEDAVYQVTGMHNANIELVKTDSESAFTDEIKW